MKQKISPIGSRLVITHKHQSQWFVDPRNGSMKKKILWQKSRINQSLCSFKINKRCPSIYSIYKIPLKQFKFVSIFKLNANPSNSTNPISFTWIHKSYPYLQKVHINFNQNKLEIVSALNQAMLNPNLRLLQQEIDDIKQLLNIAESKNSQYVDILENKMGTCIVNFLLSYHIRKDLKKQLDYLQNLEFELKSPPKITELDFDQYQIKEENTIEMPENVTFTWPLQDSDLVGSFRDRGRSPDKKWKIEIPSVIIPDKKMDPYGIIPSPLEIQNLFSEGDRWQFQVWNCGGWIIGNENFQLKNQFSTEAKTKLEADLENDGQAGLFELYCLVKKKTFIGEDENVLKAIQDILYFVFPVYKELNYLPIPKNSKYEDDSAIINMKNYAKNMNDEYSNYTAVDYVITINTNSEFKDEAVRKEAWRAIKKVVKHDYLW